MSVLKRRKPTKAEIETARKFAGKGSIDLDCSRCSELVVGLNPDTASVICSRCVQQMVEPPDQPKVSSGRPRGWQFKKEYRAPDGTLYSYGEPVDERVQSSVEQTPSRKRKKSKR